MSRLLVLLNRLKAEARPDWLTDSQRTAVDEIQRLWRFPERINLYGPRGSGKTFLAWSAARAYDASLYPSPRIYHASATPGTARVVIDNAPDDGTALRRLLAELQLSGTQRALIITTLPNRLGLVTVALPQPTPQDVDIVHRNLSLLDYYSLSPHYNANLWSIISQVL